MSDMLNNGRPGGGGPLRDLRSSAELGRWALVAVWVLLALHLLSIAAALDVARHQVDSFVPDLTSPTWLFVTNAAAHLGLLPILAIPLLIFARWQGADPDRVHAALLAVAVVAVVGIAGALGSVFLAAVSETETLGPSPWYEVMRSASLIAENVLYTAAALLVASHPEWGGRFR